jgi:anti-sigma factor (TIGR02949 family)
VVCELAHLQLHAYFDGELDAVSAAAFEKHLESCVGCQAQLEAEEALRASISKADLYEAAPSNLRKAVAARLPAKAASSATTAKLVNPAWRWLALAASLLLVATLGWDDVQRFSRTSSETPMVAAAVDAHLRSLQLGHLADVQSTDQHTVKPWFDGKLDFAPPVRDFQSEGFPLLGGRLDVLDGKTVGALVYGRRKHIVNVFVSPAANAESAATSGEENGYNWLAWQKGGFRFYAVSDVSPTDLQQLKQLFLNQ